MSCTLQKTSGLEERDDGRARVRVFRMTDTDVTPERAVLIPSSTSTMSIIYDNYNDIASIFKVHSILLRLAGIYELDSAEVLLPYNSRASEPFKVRNQWPSSNAANAKEQQLFFFSMTPTCRERML